MALGVIVVPEEKPFIKALESYTAKFSNLSSGKNTVAIGLDTRNATKALGQISGNVKNFEASLAASNARVIAFGASTAVLGGVIAGFKELATATVEVEKSLTDVNRVFGLTSAGLQKLSTDLFEVSKITASSFKDASQALLEFSRQGVPAAEALQRTKDALTLTRLAGVETGAAVESLTAAVNGFSASGLNTTQILNKLVAVEQNYAVSAGDLSEALSRTGQAAQEAGVDINQLNALVTAAQQNTARGGAVIGNALKTIFTRIQRGGTLDQLEAFNVTVRDVAGNVLPAVEILKNFAAVYKDLGTSQKSQLSEQIAGIYQVNILKALIKDLNSENSVYAGSLEIGANATNEAEVATAKLNSTLSALFSRVGTGSTQLLNNIGKVTFDPLVRSASSVVEQVLDVFNKTLEGDGAGSFFANGLLKGIRNILGGPAAVGAFFALSNIIKTSFSYVAEIAPRLVGITTEASKRRDIEASVLAILQQESVATAILSDSQTNINQKVSNLVGYLTTAATKYEQMVSLSRQLAPLLAEQGISVSSTRGLSSNKTNKSGGHIPDMVRKAEIQGAFDGGYVPGRVVKSPVGGVMNTAEQVKYYNGFSEPFINPPRNSKAGQNHRTESIKKVGIDPYSFEGFVPNFARETVYRGYEKTYSNRTGLYGNRNLDDIGYSKERLESLNKRYPDALFSGLQGAGNYPGFTYSTSSSKDIASRFSVNDKSIAEANVRILSEKGNARLLNRFSKNGSGVYNDYLLKLAGNKPFGVKRTSEAFSKEQEIRVLDPLAKLNFRNVSDGFIPNFIPTKLLSGYRKVLGKLKDGEFSLENLSSKKVLESFNNSGYKFEGGVGGFFDNRDETIHVNNQQSKSGQSRVLTHEAAHAFLQTTGLSKGIKSASKIFAAREPIDVQKSILGVEAARRNNYNPASYLEEALVEGSLRSSLSKRVLNKYLGLSEKQIFKSNRLYNKLNAASIDAIYSNKAEKSSDGFIPNFALNYPTADRKNAFNEYNFSQLDWKYLLKNISPKDFLELAHPLGKAGNRETIEKLKKRIVNQEPIDPVYLRLKKENEFSSPFISGHEGRHRATAAMELGVESIPAFFDIADFGRAPKLKKEELENIFDKGIFTEPAFSKTGILDVEDIKKYYPKVFPKYFSKGFVPNFAYKDSVMKLEQGISGRRAIFDTNPFPHIRNASQPTFSAAIQDHGGLNNALRDSVLGQKSAGLLSKGFVPNFAAPRNPFEDLETVSIKSRSGVNVKTSELEAALTDYIKSVDLVKSNNLQLSPKINKIIGGFELFNDDFKLVRTTAIEFANAQREAALTVAKIKQKSQESGSFKIQPVSGLSPISPAQELTRRTIDISSFGINPPSEEVGKLKQQAIDISNANIAIFQAKQDEIKQRLGYEQAREVGERAELQQQIAQNKLSKQETDAMRRILALEKKKEDAIIKDTSERLSRSLSQKEFAALKEQSLRESSVPKVSIYSPSTQNVNSQEAAIKLASRIGASEALDLAEQARNQSNLPKVSVTSNQNQEAFSRTAFSNFASSLQGANSGIISGGIVNRSIGSLSGQTPVFINESQLDALSSLSRTGIEFGKAGSGSQIKGGTISGVVNDLVGNNISASYGVNQSTLPQIGGLSGGGQFAVAKPNEASKATSTSFFGRINEKANNPNVGLTLGIGGPLLSGLLEQAAYGNKSRTELSSGERFGKSALGFGVSAAATGASIGSVVGPIGGISGTLIGGVAGALLGLVGAANDAQLSFEELVQQSDELKAKNQENRDSAKNYIDLLQQKNQLTDPDKIITASLSLKDVFESIKDVKLQDAFKSAKDDVSELTKALGDYDKKIRIENRRSEQTAKISNISKIEGDEKKIASLGFQKYKITDRDRVSGRRPRFLGERDPRNISAAQSQIGSLLEDLSSMPDEVAYLLQRNIDSSEVFSPENISSLLKAKGGVDPNIVDPLVEQLSEIFSGKGPILEFIRNNLAFILIDFKQKTKKDKTSSDKTLKAQNQFNEFRLALNKSIFDELEAVNQAAKTFEFDKSVQSLLTDKMQEIGDGMFSAILSNASELGQLSVKQAQVAFTSQIQARQLSESLSKVTESTDFKKQEASGQLKRQLNELDIPSLPKNEGGKNLIKNLLNQAQSGNLTEDKTQEFLNQAFNTSPKVRDAFSIESFADYAKYQGIPDITAPLPKFSVSELSELTKYQGVPDLLQPKAGLDNETQKIFLEIRKIISEYSKLNTEADRELKIEQLRIGYVKTLNEISERTAINQLDLEKKRLSISISQKDATNRLTLESGLSSISKGTVLESEKIRQGGEFRFLGLDRKQEFVAKQADQQRVFQLEQSIEKDKITAEVNQSILEIAAQNANTEAVDANTLANLDLTKAVLTSKLSEDLPKEQKDIFSSLQDRNNQAKVSFANRNEVAKFELFNGSGRLPDSQSLRDSAKLLRERAEGENPTLKSSLEEQAGKLELAAKRIDDSATLFGEKSKQAASDFEKSSGFVNNMAIGFSSLSASADDIVNKLGREVPSMFADGIANAITRGITGAQKIGDALRDSAISFGQQIISDLLKASLYKAIGSSGIGSVLGNQKGGVITAQNGMYISGGRTGDRNLALLEDGEYVLNRNAVKAAGGKGALDQFNFNHAPRFGGRFASGGEFGNLAEIKYATPKGKDAGYDFTNSIITGSNASQKIDDSNYSAYAYENDQYFIKKREKAVQDLAEKVQRDFVNKQKNAALISTLVGAAGSLTLSAGISQLGKQAQLGSQAIQAAKSGNLMGTTTDAQKALSSFSERQLGRFIANNPGSFSINGPGYGPGLNFLSNQNSGLFGLNKFNSFSSTLSRAGFSGTKGSSFSLFGQGLGEATKIARRGNQEGGVIGLNGGGYLPHGSRLGDTIPALLTGGEYVLNNTAVKNNGLSKLNAMNAGVVEGKNSSTTNTNNNATNISINIDRSGKTVVGASTNSYEKQDLILTKDMARSIHAVVLKTISNEKRYNGELYKNPLRN